MKDSDVRERPSRMPRTAGPGFDLVALKLRRPVARPGTISRSSLIGRLARDDLRPIVSVVARSGAALWSMTTPVVLVLDDVHLLRDARCRDALSVLADHVPAGSRLVLAGRGGPPLRIARLRAEGRLLEIGPGDLALTRQDAAALLRAAGLVL